MSSEPCKTCLPGRPNHRRQVVKVQKDGTRVQVCELGAAGVVANLSGMPDIGALPTNCDSTRKPSATGLARRRRQDRYPLQGTSYRWVAAEKTVQEGDACAQAGFTKLSLGV